ncbi:hypothetical protein D3C80_1542610 [compost metagenome]
MLLTVFSAFSNDCETIPTTTPCCAKTFANLLPKTPAPPVINAIFPFRLNIESILIFNFQYFKFQIPIRKIKYGYDLVLMF